VRHSQAGHLPRKCLVQLAAPHLPETPGSLEVKDVLLHSDLGCLKTADWLVRPGTLQVMTPAIPLAFCALLGVLAVFQLLLIIGLPFGRFAWGGQSTVLPTRERVGGVVSIVIYAAFAVVALERAGLISILASRVRGRDVGDCGLPVA
jgi:hypothetical protein